MSSQNQVKQILPHLVSRSDISESQSFDVFSCIIDGKASEVEIACLLTALRMKGESGQELAGAVRAVRSRMLHIERPKGLWILDTCGTGGDGANTVNISTAAAIVVSACGVAVAKHGNRSASGNSGSSEVLGRLGIQVDLKSEQIVANLCEIGLAFLYAPNFHPALRHASSVRQQLPFRTMFNLIGPLANPIRPDFQIIGVSGATQASLVSEALLQLGTKRAAIVHGEDGLDEVTLGDHTSVHWIENDSISTKKWLPSDFGLPMTDASELRVTGPEESATQILAMLQGQEGPVRSSVLANSAAALLVCGKVESLRDGVRLSSSAIDSGKAMKLLERWRVLSQIAPSAETH